MTRIILVIMSLLLISGCSNWTLKRSANNKLIDSKGFEGGKRRPLYNKKYINRAKKNIVENNYEEDDYDDADEADEVSDPAASNRYMYKKMADRDAKRKAHQSQMMLEDDRGYPKLGRARSIVDEGGSDKSQEELQREIGELKKMMVETKKDLARYRCPMQNDGTSQTRNSQGGRPKSARSLSNSMGVE